MKQLLLLTGFISFSIFSKAQDVKWAKGFGSTDGVTIAKSVATDASGNSYTTGYFSETVDFDPGEGVYNLTSEGGTDIFVLKLDASGNFVWAKRIGGPADDQGLGISLDASGNIYLVGSFRETVDFDPGEGVDSHTSMGLQDIFILKLNPAGNYLWSLRKGGRVNDAANAVTTDAEGNILVIGTYAGTDGYPVSDEWVSLKGSPDVFISKIDANGTFIWTRFFGSVGTETSGGVAVDNVGNVYITGSFAGEMNPQLPPPNTFLRPKGLSDIFVIKLSVDGVPQWVKAFGGTHNDSGNSIAVDQSGNIYLAGAFSTAVTFDPADEEHSTLSSKGLTDIFVAKLNNSGDFLWAKGMGGAENDAANALTINSKGHILTTGVFRSEVDFSTGPEKVSLTAAGNSDIFILQLSSSGEFIGAKRIGGIEEDVATAIAATSSDRFAITGSFKGTADFNPGNGSYSITSTGATDMFISLFAPKTPAPVSLLHFSAMRKQSQVLLLWQTASESNSDRFEIERSLNGIDFEKIGEVNAAGHSPTLKSYRYEDRITNLNSRVTNVYYRLKQVDRDGTYAFSAVRRVEIENATASFSVYPNPASSVIYVRGSGKIRDNLIRLVDGSGRTLLTRQLRDEVTRIDISHLPSGIYFVELGNSDRVSRQIIKKQD